MAAFLKPKSDVFLGYLGCCSCNKTEEPCNCCDMESSDYYYEAYGFDVCPFVSEPCGGAETASCANLKIGPVVLYSEEFPTECLETKSAKAAVYYSADNFGFVTGKSGQVGCPSTNACDLCDQYGVITPFIEGGSGGKSRMYIRAFGQNGPSGGPYNLLVTANFYLE